MKLYFAKLLPIEGEIKEVKLFLCSRAFKVGDEVTTPYPTNTKNIIIDEGHLEYFKTLSVIPFDKKAQGVWLGSYILLGEVSEEATWVKEDDEFDEDEIEGVLYCKKHPDESIYGYSMVQICKWLEVWNRGFKQEKYKLHFEIKGCCGHFH